ncbi:hypothetical protein LXT21_21735 [Myxococcus sp. K38C18041901]|uniref:hypothetical protein n=1 Tax=Myxococcus guangdongensis TaxID=2906760 RepID=UPI0020A74672|nr:hypothetical protein [Myxococcus guangdongensis]MCP3061408.1 hypothetical protein [Myxococcus guangdongensis]
MTHGLPRFAFLVVLFLLAAPPVEAAREPRRVASVTSIIGVWKESQHLYVKGDVGATDAQLEWLEAWLTQQAPRWTVVLMTDANGERYVDAEGTAFRDIDAALHALGKGLSNRTNFGALKNPRTGESDGTVLLISLAERRLSYFAADAKDRRGLGEDRWAGSLDVRAVDAMRNGGRLVDAVTNTVDFIETQLRAALDKEEFEQARRIEALRSGLLALQKELPGLEERRLSVFGSAIPPRLPEASLDLEVAGLTLRQALALLAPPQKADFPKAKALYDGLRADLDGLRAAMESRRLASDRLKVLEAALESLPGHRFAGFAKPQLEALDIAVENANAAVRDMSPSHRDALIAAESARVRLGEVLSSAEKDERRLKAMDEGLKVLEAMPTAESVQGELAAARAAQQTAREAFDTRSPRRRFAVDDGEEALRRVTAAMQRAEEHRRMRDTGATAGGAGLLLAGVLARRRRNASRRKASEEHERFRTVVDEKTQALFDLLERTHLVAGKSRDDIARRFEGLTRERGQQLASDVDELFLLVTAAARVLHRAEELLAGTGPLNALGAHLGTSRYEKVTELLRDAPIVFHPDEGVEGVLRGPRSHAQRLIGDVKSYQPFSLSFLDLLEAFNVRAQRALLLVEALERVAQVALDGVAGLEAFCARLRSLTPGAEVLRVKRVVALVVPSLESLVAAARPLLAKDPMAAVEGPLTEGGRRLEDAGALVVVMTSAVGQVAPSVERAGAALMKAGLSRRWLEDALAARGEATEKVAKALLEAPVGDAVSSLEQSCSALATQAAETADLVALAARAQDALGRARSETTSAREALGRELDMPASALLNEQESNPTDRHSVGTQMLATAREALAEGRLETAREALEAVLARVEEVRGIIERSREAQKTFASRRDACREVARRLESRVADGTVLLESLRKRYRPSALLLRPEDPVHPEANGTVQDNLTEVGRHRLDAANKLKAAELAFTEARLLASADLLGQVERLHALIEARLLEVEEKSRRLQVAEEHNTGVLQAARGLLAACTADVSDVRVMRPTVKARDAAQGLLQAAAQLTEARPADPFAAGEKLTAACLALEQVRQSVARDRAQHAQAQDSVASAQRAVSSADVWIRQAANDGIADSRATVVAVNALLALGSDLSKAQEELGRPHGDWVTLDSLAGRIASDAARRTADLRGELRSAEQAANAIDAAARLVREAGSWHGRPGGSSLEEARRSLDRGQYLEAERAAGMASRAASDAIEEAEAERRREEARSRESSWSSSSSSSSSWSSSSSSSSSSSDSGFSSSSYGGGSSGSGSGFGSSSW